jgi:hypothetical protein
MPDLAAVLAGLILIVSESTVQGRKLTQLITLQFVLSFRDRGSLNRSV